MSIIQQLQGEQSNPFQFRNYGYAIAADVNETDQTVRFAPPICTTCGERSEPMTLDLAKFREWRVQGKLIQEVWPEFSVEMREWLMTGTHGPCFTDMFKGEE